MLAALGMLSAFGSMPAAPRASAAATSGVMLCRQAWGARPA